MPPIFSSPWVFVLSLNETPFYLSFGLESCLNLALRICSSVHPSPTESLLASLLTVLAHLQPLLPACGVLLTPQNWRFHLESFLLPGHHSHQWQFYFPKSIDFIMSLLC